MLSFYWIKRFFIDLNLSVFLFIYYYLLKGFFYQLIFCPVFLPSLPSLGWEVFYQRHDLLRLISFSTWLRCFHWSIGFFPKFPNRLGGFLSIPTSIHLTELMSKKESNFNVMITGLADHELHVIFLNTAISSSSYRFIVPTTSSPLYQLGHKSALDLSGIEVLRIAY